jgi:hypothetical protein
VTTTASALPPTSCATTGWPVAGRIIDAIIRRDFASLAACLHPDVRMRAVLPRAVLDIASAQTVAAKFDDWFGGEDGFEVLDASAGMIGVRQYVRWRIRMWPPDDPSATRVIEQHSYTRGTECIESLDLLCSGFQLERPDGAR